MVINQEIIYGLSRVAMVMIDDLSIFAVNFYVFCV